MFRKIKVKFENLLKDKKIILGFLIVLSLIVIAKTIWLNQPAEVKTVAEEIQVDTLIPLGFVLVPIQIQNFDAASALLGSAGIVDLWSFDPVTHRKSKRIASRIKIIRAPLNPQMYAVLVHENESEKILTYGDTFMVTVQSERSNSPEILSEKKHVQNQIETYDIKE